MGMRDKELYKQIMGIYSPWEVTEVELSMETEEVTVHVEQEVGTQQSCPHAALTVQAITSATGDGDIWIPASSRRYWWQRYLG